MTTFTNRQDEINHYRECDTRIAAAWDLYHDVNYKITELAKGIKSDVKMVDYYRNRPQTQARYAERIAQKEAQINELRPQAGELRNAAVQLDKDLYTGWSRFFLVQHIHSNTHCSSFRPTTRIGWLPSVSGLTEAEAVSEHGATLCTICFPSAPTELTTKQADPSICEGSGKMYDGSKLTGRELAYYSPTGTCSVCGTTQSLAARGSLKIRKHKK